MSGAEPRGALASDAQLAADRLLIRLLADPRVREAQARLKQDLLTDPSAATRDGQAWLDYAIGLYAGSIGMRELGADPSRPVVLRDLEPAPLRWHGMDVPGRGTSGESVDNIYRFVSLDGDYSYVLTGSMPVNGPTHFSLDARAASARKPPGHPAPPGRSDSGIQLGLLTEADLVLAPDRSFTITIDASPSGGRPNHFQIAPGPVTVLIRNVLGDWTQAPTPLSIRRTDSLPDLPEVSFDQLARNTADDLHAWAHYWFEIPRTLLGAPPPNTIPVPVPRDGGWGRLTICHFELAADEALVIRTARADARYTGAQVLGPWLVPPDPRHRLVSRNITQTTPAPDGAVTYVISPRDLGAPNWLDSLGLERGVVMLRWSGISPDVDAARLVLDHQVLKQADVQARGWEKLPATSAEQRARELEQRAAEYALRATL